MIPFETALSSNTLESSKADGNVSWSDVSCKYTWEIMWRTFPRPHPNVTIRGSFRLTTPPSETANTSTFLPRTLILCDPLSISQDGVPCRLLVNECLKLMIFSFALPPDTRPLYTIVSGNALSMRYCSAQSVQMRNPSFSTNFLILFTFELPTSPGQLIMTISYFSSGLLKCGETRSKVIPALSSTSSA